MGRRNTNGHNHHHHQEYDRSRHHQHISVGDGGGEGRKKDAVIIAVAVAEGKRSRFCHRECNRRQYSHDAVAIEERRRGGGIVVEGTAWAALMTYHKIGKNLPMWEMVGDTKVAKFCDNGWC